MRRIAALGVPTLVVAQYLPSAWNDPAAAAEEHRVSRVVLQCAEQAGLAALDLYDLFEQAVRTNGRDFVYREWHPNARGYRLTAEAIARTLQQHGMLPR
jgi:lysophospholipase L1-like esterase